MDLCTVALLEDFPAFLWPASTYVGWRMTEMLIMNRKYTKCFHLLMQAMGEIFFPPYFYPAMLQQGRALKTGGAFCPSILCSTILNYPGSISCDY